MDISMETLLGALTTDDGLPWRLVGDVIGIASESGGKSDWSLRVGAGHPHRFDISVSANSEGQCL